jgi:hypothetical protein
MGPVTVAADIATVCFQGGPGPDQGRCDLDLPFAVPLGQPPAYRVWVSLHPRPIYEGYKLVDIPLR